MPPLSFLSPAPCVVRLPAPGVINHHPEGARVHSWQGAAERPVRYTQPPEPVPTRDRLWFRREITIKSYFMGRIPPRHTLFAFLYTTCPARERSMTAQALGCPGTGPPLRFNCNLSFFPCQRGLSSIGLRPLSGLLHALCAFLSPLPCFRAMVRK